MALGELADRQDEEAEPGLDYAARAAKAVSYQWVRRLAKKDTAGAIRYLDELQRQIDKCRAELLTVQDGTPVIPAPSEASAHDQASRVS